MNIIFISSLFHHGECSPHEVVDDDVRGPEELDHVGHHVDLSPAPVRAGVQKHSGNYYSDIQDSSLFTRKINSKTETLLKPKIR